jgi:hypothetical protein
MQGLLACSLTISIMYQHTGLHELQYYDRLRDTHQINSLSSVWDEALEQLANIKDMAVALSQELDKAIDEITNNPSKWQSYYPSFITFRELSYNKIGCCWL